MRFPVLGVALLVVGACAPKRIHEEPVLRTGDRVPGESGAVDVARADADGAAEARARRDSLSVVALSTCAADVCGGLAGGEVMLGMNTAQVLAATRTTEGAWQFRGGPAAQVMVPASLDAPPRDALGEIALIQLRDGRVSTYSYREAQGVRMVAEPADATTAGRASALAEMLVREGDDLTARGDLRQALDRYDRAQILRPGDALVDYRIATVLDKQLRPIEALVRYQLFLHRLELEKIEARGRASGYLADAIAQARQRVIVLEKQAR